jgi:flagellar hook protein FlgE
MENGVSGLRAEGEALGVVGDNVANVSTLGFKKQRSLFEDVLLKSGTPGGGGAGVEQSRAQQVFSQGALAQTGIPTDLALSGEGFFVVSGSVNGVTSSFYSRAGQFRVDAAGFMVNPAGLKLLGRMAQADGSLAAAPSPLVVSTAGIPARATSTVQISANLDASDTEPAVAFDPANPENTANASTALQIFDSLGQAHDLEVYFEKTDLGQWNYHALVRGDDLNPAQPGVNVEVGNGSLTFTGNGALDTRTTTTALNVNFEGATQSQAIEFDFGSTLSGGGSGLDGTTQFSMPSGFSAQSQNGYSSGALSGVSIASNGMVEGLYSNGMRAPVGQLVIAKFRSEDGLARAGEGLWMATKESGDAALGAPASGGRGALSAGALETSNVELGEEFVGMIQHQRAYSANSKVIATADDMLTELMQLKR